MANKQKLIILTDENQEAIKEIRHNHPELVTDVSAIRFALKHTATEAEQATSKATKNDRIAQIAKAQNLNTIMLASMLRVMKISVPAEGDLLDDEEIEAAEKMRKRHMNSVVRQKRHS